MIGNNQYVYLVEVDYECEIGGTRIHGNDKIGIYEDLQDAVEEAMMNADSDVMKDDVMDAMEAEGMCELWWHPMEIHGNPAKRVYVTITEHAVTTKKRSGS